MTDFRLLLTNRQRSCPERFASGETRDPDHQVFSPDETRIGNPGFEREECCTIYPPRTMQMEYTRFKAKSQWYLWLILAVKTVD